MAETFKSVNADLGTSANASIYQCPSSTTAIVILCQVANVDGTNAADVTIEVSNDDGSTYFKLANTISVPADSSLDFLSNPIYLDETDILAVTAGAANDLSFFVSYEELDDA